MTANATVYLQTTLLDATKGSKGWYFTLAYCSQPSGGKNTFVKNEFLCLFKSSPINTESKIIVLDATVVKQLYVKLNTDFTVQHILTL